VRALVKHVSTSLSTHSFHCALLQHAYTPGAHFHGCYEHAYTISLLTSITTAMHSCTGSVAQTHSHTRTQTRTHTPSQQQQEAGTKHLKSGQAQQQGQQVQGQCTLQGPQHQGRPPHHPELHQLQVCGSAGMYQGLIVTLEVLCNKQGGL